MEYKDYRKNIKSGDLLAWTHRGWKSFYDIQIQAIRFFTQSEYSHVGIAWWSADRLFIIEALPPRVRIFPLSLAGDFYHIDINEPFEKEVEEFALNQVGEEYSKWLAIKSFFSKVKRGDNNLWHCGVLTNEILLVNGIDIGTAQTPSQVVQAVLEQGKSVNYVSNT